MSTQLSSYSAVFHALFNPVFEVYSFSDRPYRCPDFTDLDFLQAGTLRALSESISGRDFLQRHADHDFKDIELGHWFKSLKSSRRLTNLHSVNRLLSPIMQSQIDDPFARFHELDGFNLYAGDGHSHAAACHDPLVSRSDGSSKRLPVGHFFMLNMRTHHLRHLKVAEIGGARRGEHDMRVLKKMDIGELRDHAAKGQKTMIVWDRAGIDFRFWHQLKQTAGIYFTSRTKDNMNLMVVGKLRYDPNNSINDGVLADEYVEPGSGGNTFRRVTYLDPDKSVIYEFLTTELTLPPGLIVLLYKHRWDIEKVFDEIKVKLGEEKAWASSAVAKTMHANFLCLTHNLMMLLEDKIERAERISNQPEKKRRKSRMKKLKKEGKSNLILTAIQRFTQRTVKFIRWLRNHVYREVSWAKAMAHLSRIYARR